MCKPERSCHSLQSCKCRKPVFLPTMWLRHHFYFYICLKQNAFPKGTFCETTEVHMGRAKTMRNLTRCFLKNMISVFSTWLQTALREWEYCYRTVFHIQGNFISHNNAYCCSEAEIAVAAEVSWLRSVMQSGQRLMQLPKSRLDFIAVNFVNESKS